VSDDFKIQVNFKVPTSNDNYRDSLVNVRANDAEELSHTLGELTSVAADIVGAGAALNAAAITAYGLGARAIATESGPTQQAASTSPAQSTSANQGQAVESGAGQQNLGPDRFGRTFVIGHPDAPTVNFGKSAGQKAVKMTAQSKPEFGGGTYSQWIDPADKAVPGNWEKGNRDKGEWGPQKVE
jgi:hypothetical protein